MKRDTLHTLRSALVGWALGAVVATGCYWFDVSMWAAVPVLLVVTFLATLSML
jgi:hypothetical protein